LEFLQAKNSSADSKDGHPGYANDVTSPICFSPLPDCFLKFFENVVSPRKPPHALVRKLDSR
jgi:hypothetical protein